MDATSGTAGTNWDQLVVSGDLDFAGVDSVTIKLISLDAAGDPGALASFDPNSDFSIAIANATSVSVFSMNAFSVDTSDFANTFTGSFYMSASGNELLLNYTEFLLGDVSMDGVVNLLDVGPFIDAIAEGDFIEEADVNRDGVVNLLDVGPFILRLSS